MTSTNPRHKTLGLRPVLVLLALVANGIGLIGHTNPAVAANTENVQVAMPFAGRWAYNTNVNPPYTDQNSSHPSIHPNPGGGDWATDLYAAVGTAVRFRIGTASGTVTYSWKAVSGSCGGSTGISIFVDGVHVGWLYYTHLGNAVTSGAISNGMTLGTVADFGNCNAGHHIHVEYRNVQSGHSCYYDKGNPGVQVLDGMAIALLGADSPGVKQACGSGEAPASGTATRLVGYVNNDSKADAVLVYRGSGNVYVALSSAPVHAFGYPGLWAGGHSAGANRYMLADVNGDQLDDLVAYFASTGRWAVSISSGSGFWSPVDWAFQHGPGTARQWVADVNHDEKADAITFDGTVNGHWRVSLSTGTGFSPHELWRTGHGVSSSNQTVADFNDDGRADAAIFVAGTGSWYVATSSGSSLTGFNYPGQWSAGHGPGHRQLAGDVNGDGKADEAFFYTDIGHVDAGISTGTGFFAPTAWAHGHGNNTTDQFLADATGDGKDDFITFDAAATNGDWRVSQSTGTGFSAPELWIHGHGAGS